jgi:hypothetical protein
MPADRRFVIHVGNSPIVIEPDFDPAGITPASIDPGMAVVRNVARLSSNFDGLRLRHSRFDMRKLR